MKKILYMAMPLLIFATLLSSCKDDDVSKGDPWLQMTSGTGSFIVENGVADIRVTINSNVKWTLGLEFDDPESPWASVYPARGEDDGRVYLYLDPLDIPYGRTCRLAAYDMSGNELAGVELTQIGTQAHITVDNSLALSSSSDGGQYSIPVDANVNWAASILPLNQGDDISWINLAGATAAAQSITIDPNTGDAKRFAVVRFFQVEDPALYTELQVVQLPVYSIGNAQLITIATLLSDYSGVIEDNLKVEGFVVSDKETANIPDNELYIQDASGRGLLISFGDAQDNIYALDQKLTVWATGGTLRTEVKEYSGASYKVLTSLSSSNFSTVTTSLTGTEAEPVEITDMTRIDDYPNTLVTLRNVTFALPIGTLFKGRGDHADCGNSYLSTLRDGAGNTAVMRTLKSFTGKWDGGITDDCYDITALVLPDNGEIMPGNNPAVNPPARLTHERYKHTLRVRSYSDLSVTGATNPYTPIALWYETSAPSTSTTNWAPKVGSGTFNITDNGGSTATISARDSYTRVQYDNPDITYRGFGRFPGWDASTGGQYWKFSVSTAGCTGNICVSFMCGNFGSAGRYWKVEWSSDDITWNDVPGAAYELWNNSTTTSVADLNHIYLPQEFFYMLPAGAAGQTTLYVRLIVTANIRASATGSTVTIAATSPTNIYYVGVYEKQ